MEKLCLLFCITFEGLLIRMVMWHKNVIFSGYHPLRFDRKLLGGFKLWVLFTSYIQGTCTFKKIQNEFNA